MTPPSGGESTSAPAAGSAAKPAETLPPPEPPASNPPPEPAIPSGPGVNFVERIWATWRAVVGDDSIAQLSAALAYRTIFSLIPLLLLAFLLLRLFKDTESLIERLLYQFLELTGLSQIAVGDQGTENIQSWINELVLGFSRINFTGIGLVSAVTLVYAAISLVVQMETAFNTIYGAARARSFSRRIAQSWLIVSLGPLLVFASFMVADRFTALAVKTNVGEAPLVGQTLLIVLGYGVAIVITTLLLSTLYLVIPNARVYVWPALVGGLTGAVGMELAKAGFNLYLRGGGLKSLYGSLALLPLFLLWIYVTWAVVLLGLRIAYVMQHGHWRAVRRAWVASAESCSMQGRAIDPAQALAVLQVIASGFKSGRQVTIGHIASKTELEVALVRRIAARLTLSGITHRIGGTGERSPRAEAFALSRPPEAIDAAEVVRAAHAEMNLGPPTGGAAIDRFATGLREAQVRAARGRTLADLLSATATK